MSNSQSLVKRRDEITAYNYAALVANKIHSDDGAAQYGFRGALVPGIALYGYCTQAAVRQFGSAWLKSGFIRARFAQPIYHHELISIASSPADGADYGATSLDIQLIKPDGAVSTQAMASMDMNDVVDGPASAGAFAVSVVPEESQRREPRISSFEIGQALGTIQFTTPVGDAAIAFAGDMVDLLECYREPQAQVHPAKILAQANQVLISNIALGPWVHTASEVQHHKSIAPGQTLSLRSRVKDLQEKRGHEVITVDILVLDEQLQTVAAIRHNAIIHLARK